jgi:hypothetical protein
MSTTLLRFRDLKERRIVGSWPQLANLQRDQGFPLGKMIGPNTRAWTDDEIDAWVESRPIAGPAPRGVAKRKEVAQLVLDLGLDPGRFLPRRCRGRRPLRSPRPRRRGGCRVTDAQADAEAPATAPDSNATPVAEITVFKKRSGTLSKRIHLVEGKLSNDTAACAMAEGFAKRVTVDLRNMNGLAAIIDKMAPQMAYANGRMKDGVPNKVRVVKDDKLASFDGDPGVIARSKEYLGFVDGKPALCLHDVDVKAMGETAAARLGEIGVWAALCAVVPALANAARVIRASTSTGLRNSETGETYPASGGCHIAVAVADGADVKRYLDAFSDRLWLAGWGWGMVSGCGSFLERSLVDKAVASPERLIFEGAPTIVPPLVQAPRLAEAFEGDIIDTLTACPPLSAAEAIKVAKLKEDERARLAPQMAATRPFRASPRKLAGGLSPPRRRDDAG